MPALHSTDNGHKALRLYARCHERKGAREAGAKARGRDARLGTVLGQQTREAPQGAHMCIQAAGCSCAEQMKVKQKRMPM